MRHSAFFTVALLLSQLCFAAETAYEPEGTPLTTGSAAGEMSLPNGVSLRVSPRSAGTLYDDHLVVENGAVRVGNFSGYTVDARQLHIQAQDAGAQAVVSVANNQIEVASLGGDLNVSQGGAMLARVAAGTHVSFRRKDQSSANYGYHDRHLMLWIICITAAAALAIGLTAAAQGKSPF